MSSVIILLYSNIICNNNTAPVFIWSSDPNHTTPPCSGISSLPIHPPFSFWFIFVSLAITCMYMCLFHKQLIIAVLFIVIFYYLMNSTNLLIWVFHDLYVLFELLQLYICVLVQFDFVLLFFFLSYTSQDSSVMIIKLFIFIKELWSFCSCWYGCMDVVSTYICWKLWTFDVVFVLQHFYWFYPVF